MVVPEIGLLNPQSVLECLIPLPAWSKMTRICLEFSSFLVLYVITCCANLALYLLELVHLNLGFLCFFLFITVKHILVMAAAATVLVNQIGWRHQIWKLYLYQFIQKFVFHFFPQFEYQQAQLEAEIENLSWKVERADSYDRGVSNFNSLESSNLFSRWQSGHCKHITVVITDINGTDSWSGYHKVGLVWNLNGDLKQTVKWQVCSRNSTGWEQTLMLNYTNIS